MTIKHGLFCLLFQLILSPSWCVAETPIGNGQNAVMSCEDPAGLSAEPNTIDEHIQQKLEDIYEQNGCYVQDAEQEGKPLNDGKMGMVTKKWINQALHEREIDIKQAAPVQAPSAEQAISGIQPYILLQSDITKLRINKSVVEALKAFVENKKANSFTLEDDAWGAVNEQLSSIDGYVSLAPYYEDIIRPMIQPKAIRIIDQDALDELIIEGLEKEADVLALLLEKPILTDHFDAVVTSLLSHTLTKERVNAEAVDAEAAKEKQQAQQAKQKEEAEEQKKALALEISSAKSEVAKVSEAFKLKLDEISKLSDDAPKLKTFLNDIAVKITSLVPFKETEVEAPGAEPISDETMVKKMVARLDKLKSEDAIEHTDAMPDANKLLLMFKILNREIIKHRNLADEFAGRDEMDKVDDETYIANELHLMYYRELERFQKNISLIEGAKQHEDDQGEHSSVDVTRDLNRNLNRGLNSNLKSNGTDKPGEANGEKTQLLSPNTERTQLLTAKTPAIKNAPLSASFAKAKRLIERNAMHERRYYLALADDLSKQLPSVPAMVANCVENLVNQSYPNAYTLNYAVSAMLKRLDGEAAWIKEHPNASNQRRFKCQIEPDIAADIAFSADENQHYANDSLIQILVDQAAKNIHSDKLEPIQLDVLPGCTDCSLPMRVVNYGFYPYWKASHKRDDGLDPVRANPAALDLSAFGRIAYFAIPIEDEGCINELLHWDENDTSLIADFVKTLSRHNVKRDIVLYSKNWARWGQIENSNGLCPQNRHNIEKNGSDNEKNKDKKIRDIIHEYAEDHYKTLSTLNQNVQPYGGLSGVTLYFDHYTKEADAKNIIEYLSHLHELMSNGDSENVLDINLMLGIQGLDSSSITVGEKIIEHQPNYFKKIGPLFLPKTVDSHAYDIFKGDVSSTLKDQNGFNADGKPVVNKVLVFLNEETGVYKKALRAQIENEFSGTSRVHAQLAIVPIIVRVPLGEEGEDAKNRYQQYEDDLNYLKYNLAGIGLWDLPFTGYNQAGELEKTNLEMTFFSKMLKEDYGDSELNYMDYNSLGVVGALLHEAILLNIVDICGEVCPKRRGYTMLLTALVVICVFIHIIRGLSCYARSIIKKTNVAYIVLHLVLVPVFFALLGCDPAWQAMSGEIWTVLIAILISYGLYKFVSSTYEKDTY